ncbi:ER-bound oxygenase mpaB/mpaB'/Rubber oxygenase catalytic domain-containing protein [Pseudoscourfieldia marina]
MKPCHGVLWDNDDEDGGGSGGGPSTFRLVEGATVTHLGKSFVWTHRHIKPAVLEALRHQGDPIADAAVSSILAEVSAPLKPSWWPTARSSRKRHLVDAAISAASRPENRAARALLEQVSSLPEWADRTVCQRGGEFFMRFVPASWATLFHLSLVGGYAAGRVAKVLSLGSALGADEQRNRDRVFRRLLDTSLMVLRCVGGGDKSLEPFVGPGWRDVVRVRLLHATVSARLRKGGYDTSADGIPVNNQEDLLVTQLAFSAVVLDGLARLGVDIEGEYRDGAEAYLHLWRVVGHLIGIDESNNWACRSLDDARIALQSIWIHLVHPNEESRRLTTTSLRSLERRPPRAWTARQLAFATRYLQGDALADALGVARVDNDNDNDGELVRVLIAHTRWSIRWLDASTLVGRVLVAIAVRIFDIAFRWM